MPRDGFVLPQRREGAELLAQRQKVLAKIDPTNPVTEPSKPKTDEMRPCGAEIVAEYPDHVWSADLTAAPIMGWISFLSPFRRRTGWPFFCWILVIIDHYSRKAVGFEVFKKEPTSEEVAKALESAIAQNGQAPKHMITDQGKQFTGDAFKRLLVQFGTEHREGAVGQHGSIAVTERFIKSVKDEALRIILMPLQLDKIRREVELYFEWYNNHRPHQSRGSMTPNEVHSRAPTLKRPRVPSELGGASPQAESLVPRGKAAFAHHRDRARRRTAGLMTSAK